MRYKKFHILEQQFKLNRKHKYPKNLKYFLNNQLTMTNFYILQTYYSWHAYDFAVFMDLYEAKQSDRCVSTNILILCIILFGL